MILSCYGGALEILGVIIKLIIIIIKLQLQNKTKAHRLAAVRIG